MTTIFSELIAAAKLNPKSGEDEQTVAAKLLTKLNDAPDKVWESLSKKAQKWVNDAVDASEAKEDLPSLPGFGEADAGEEDAKPAKKAKGKPAAKEKAAKGKAKASKKAKKGNGAISGKRARLFEDDQVITVLTKENPKREGSTAYDRFELYTTGKKGMTVKQALEKGVSSGDLKWDSDRGYIAIK